jgi:F420-non-reducing hydrogenase iron-sulfur subunit
MKPSIVIYCCANSTTLPEDEVEKCVSEGKASIRMVRLPCSGRTDVLYIVRAIEEGADMAMIVGCPEDRCQYLQGSPRAKQRVGYVNRVLNEVGLGLERVKMVNLDPAHDGQFAAALRDVIAKAAELGPWLPQKGL